MPDRLLEFSATPGPSLGRRPASGPTHRRGARRGPIRRAGRPGPTPRSPRSRSRIPWPGVRVLDLGLGVAGPFTGRALADLGADVIKINALYDKYWNGTHMGLGVNRGKRSIALNLKDPDRQGSAGEAAAAL